MVVASYMNPDQQINCNNSEICEKMLEQRDQVIECMINNELPDLVHQQIQNQNQNQDQESP